MFGCAAQCSTRSTARHSQTRTRREGCRRRACSTRASSDTTTRSCTRSEATSGTARKLAAGRAAKVVVYIWDDPPYTDAFNRSLRNQLAAIGLDMTVLRSTNRDFADGGAGYVAKATRSDIIWGGLGEQTSADPATYLQPLYLPTQQRRDELARLLTLSSPERERAALAIARRVERDSLYAVYMTDALPELVSRRLGCIVHQPEYAGVDLAALCLKDSAD